MKKNILLLSLCTLLVLSFTGCGASGDSQNPTEAAGPIAPVIAESLATTECPESGAEDDLAIAIGSEALCDLGSVRFSLSLPETWDYEIRNVTTSEMTTDAIVFWNIAYPEDTFTLVYAPVPGICGTGVTSEKITLPDSGLNGIFRMTRSWKQNARRLPKSKSTGFTLPCPIPTSLCREIPCSWNPHFR